MIDGVLGEIECNDKDLCDLTDHRPELAGSPEKFFRVLDKIEGPIRQEWAVQDGVINLFGNWETRFGCSTCGCTCKENIQE